MGEVATVMVKNIDKKLGEGAYLIAESDFDPAKHKKVMQTRTVKKKVAKKKKSATDSENDVETKEHD